MTLTWARTNLERHVAKHFLGAEGEDWRSLCDRVGETPERWDAWRAAISAARCALAGHDRACPAADACGPVCGEASAPYEQLVDAEWTFATGGGLVVRYEDDDGKPCACATGPAAAFVVALELSTGPVAKTAFRDDAAQASDVTERRRLRWAVRKLRAHASSGTGGLNVGELVWLESIVLTGRATADAPERAVAVARALGVLS